MRVLVRNGVRLCVLAALCVCIAGGGVHGLDFNDILLLKRNGVDESVIVNMARKETNLSLTTAQADQLRAAGASENLIASIPRVENAPAAPSVSSAPIYSTPISPADMESSGRIIPEGTPMTPVDIVVIGEPPPLYRKQGWLTVANSDWESYFLVIDEAAERMFLSRTPNGGVEIESGHSVTLGIRKESYKLYGDSGRELKVKVREGETTRLSLAPFGVVGNSGLNGVVQDREKVRSERLFDNYVPAPAVVVQESPVIVVPGPPRYFRPRHDSFHFGYYGW